MTIAKPEWIPFDLRVGWLVHNATGADPFDAQQATLEVIRDGKIGTSFVRLRYDGKVAVREKQSPEKWTSDGPELGAFHQAQIHYGDFEREMLDRAGSKRTGRPPKKELWEAFWFQTAVALGRRYGLPNTQTELTNEMLEWIEGEGEDAAKRTSVSDRIKELYDAVGIRK